ncbi:MAG: hypothetical protein H0U76_22280 [Ktedonobacteraceae bacterium]|nr:hypothetical protein [Ktedonobacteraceae bacterium]
MITAAEFEEEFYAEDTLVYSPFVTDERLTPDCAAALYREVCTKQCWPRKTYPMLPWPMERLIGIIWRNVHTGSPTKVVAIQRDRWDNPTLCIQSHFAWGTAVPWTLGLWTSECRDGRYVIEHWVRVDQLSAEDQLPWFHLRCDWIKAQIMEHSQQQAECSRIGDKVNKRLREQDLTRDRRELAYAATQLQDFAQQAGLPIPCFDDHSMEERRKANC